MRAHCRVCRSDRALTRRGLVWAHRAHGSGPYDGLRCRGSGHPPLGQPGPDLDPAPGQWLAPHPLVAERPGGTVYLLHFEQPFGHARHYLGYAGPGNLTARLLHHQAGSGANLMRHVGKAGIGWMLARTWPGDRTTERRMKVRGHTRRCPACCPSLRVALETRLARPLDSRPKVCA